MGGSSAGWPVARRARNSESSFETRSAALPLALALTLGLASAGVALGQVELGPSWALAGGDFEPDLPIGDFDGDGSAEVVVPRALDWLTLSKSASGFRVDRVGPHSAPVLASSLGPIASADLDGDCRPELLVANNSMREIEVWDLRSQQRRLVIPTGVEIVDLGGGDLDADASGEIVALLSTPTDFVLQIYDAATGSPQASRIIPWPYRLEVAEIDGDAPLELVVWKYEDRRFVGYDGATLAEEWNPVVGWAEGFALGDFDGDLRDEIAVADTGSSRLVVFDPDDSVDGILWSQDRIGGSSGLLQGVDLDDNGVDELIVHVGSQLQVLEGPSGAFRTSVTIPFSAIRALGAGDVDGDGVSDVVWRGGPSDSCDEPVLGVLQGATLAVLWSQGGGTLRGLVKAKSSSVPDLVTAVACQGLSASHPHLLRLDGRTWRRLGALDLPELDLTPQGFYWYLGASTDATKTLLATEMLFHPGEPKGRLLSVDPWSGARQWDVPLEFQPRGLAVAPAATGVGEAVLVLDPFGSAVHAYRGSDAFPLWSSDAPPGGSQMYSALIVGQIDADPEPEVLALGPTTIGVFSGLDGHAERWIPAGGVLSLALADANGDGLVELILVGQNRLFRVVDPRTGVVGPQVDLFDPFLSLEKVVAAPGIRWPGSRDVFVLSADGRVHLIDLAGPTLVWSGERVLQAPGLFLADSSAFVDDIDGDGDLDLLVLSGDRIDRFAFPAGLLFSDDFEEGAVQRWSRIAPTPTCS